MRNNYEDHNFRVEEPKIFRSDLIKKIIKAPVQQTWISILQKFITGFSQQLFPKSIVSCNRQEQQRM